MFVCHGNICRSPMAEFIFRDMLKTAGLDYRISVASSATSTEEIWNGIGNPVYPPARREMNSHGIRCDGHCARQITRKDLETYDYIYYMDSNNRRNLNRMFPDFQGFLPFLDRDVADPWYSGDFTQTWADVQEGCKRIMEELA